MSRSLPDLKRGQESGLVVLRGRRCKRGLFRRTGSAQIDPVEHHQPLAEYIESFHARSSLTRARLGAAAAQFDAEIQAVVAPDCPTGMVRLEVGAEMIWGIPQGGPNVPASLGDVYPRIWPEVVRGPGGGASCELIIDFLHTGRFASAALMLPAFQALRRELDA